MFNISVNYIGVQLK